jgi:TetR/AcrR family transcriptional repressor of nem operon
LIRLADFVAEAAAGMERYAFQRGCLLGNLGQEVTLLSPEMREKITATLRDWEDRLLVLLQEARASGELKAGLNIEDSAACFWTGWEGAVLVARLRRSSRPMENFFTIYLGTLQSPFKLQTEGP